MDSIHYIGVDIAKATFDVAMTQSGHQYRHQTFDNTPKGFEAFFNFLRDANTVRAHIAMEATNIYWFELAQLCHQQTGLIVSVLNPLQVAAYAKSNLQRGKTDKMDARLIARFCEKEQPPPWQPLSDAAQQLMYLLRQYDHLKDQIRQEQNRLQTADSMVQPIIQDTICALDKQVKQVKTIIQQHIGSDDDLSAGKRLLQSIPGVGEQTIPWLLAYLDNGHRFERGKQAACYAGLTPRPWQSGTSIKGRTPISKVGPSELRKILYMPAVVVSYGKHKHYQAFVRRLETNGKQKLEVIVAVMRKIITIAQAVLRTRTPFNPLLHEN